MALKLLFKPCLCGPASAERESAVSVTPSARRDCPKVSFAEDFANSFAGFKSLLLCLQMSKGLAGITGVGLHLSPPEKRLREEK